MSMIAEAKHLKAYYITQSYGVERTVKAVDDISIGIREKEVLGIAGESGCGKSTLLKVLLGAIDPPLRIIDGTMQYEFAQDSYNVFSMSKDEIKQTRWTQVSYIPQGSMHVLNPVRRVSDTFHDFIATHRDLGRSETAKLARDYLQKLGLPEQVMSVYPHQLSGGMRQRVTIALATILSPKLVLADEPTTALDVLVQRGVVQLLKEIQQREGSTLVLVSHDMGVHANLADRIAILYAGKLVEEAETQRIFKTPQHPYTQYLIESLPRLGDKTERSSIPGRPPALDNPPEGCRFHPRCPHAMDVCTKEVPPLVNIGDGHKTACFLVSEEKK
ncbi:TPA: ABC transporter ATP-binding protein [Candidatus Poribacteria bacterium]|nr:ABC transporter ATP-binding protein [Candidatus Poribacteria bacterium]HIA70752.1 ABC transporter ATP-binding protein [Candidatus Poribacteria bacterium]HIB87934.1 ABC transporter ATP-binding protein [Candidatus Poribacteria bacterium]HIC00995.1 ABC transporter ATP-binding protein [Candidatus Poribacteria bacterium]HIN31685.1 ABC transporter ATP-binding protein [Candidatus Poribacteria bacterium]